MSERCPANGTLRTSKASDILDSVCQPADLLGIADWDLHHSSSNFLGFACTHPACLLFGRMASCGMGR
jgi:hypothetical protein